MKAYLRYVPTTTFGVVASSAQCTDVLLDGKGKRAIAACLEEACAFDLRLGAKVRITVYNVLWSLSVVGWYWEFGGDGCFGFIGLRAT